MKRIQPEARDEGMRPMMTPGDNNRKPFAPMQTVNKVFQRYRGAQQNPPGYGMGDTVPFNMDDGYHY